ncbi:MAG: O-antigen ligase family protein [Candidatus Omnitrophica bacterium]|nr:O-antigen ligase family protein [Candidatus Omnitrophota bacterium]
MKLFLFIIVFANFIAILVGRILIFGAHSSWFYAFISEAKTFQIGMVYGISSAFLLSSYNYLKNKAFRLLILVLVPINLYMIITFGVRSLWVAVICLAVFLVLILGFRIMAKIYLKLLVSFVLISTVLFYIDFEVFKSPQLNVFIGRGRSFVCAFARLSSKFTLPNEYDEATLKKELKRNDKPAFSNVQNKLEIGGESGRAGKPLSLNKPDKSVLGKDSERIGYDNIVWRKKVWKQTIEFTSGSYLFGKGFGHYPAYNIRGYQKPRSAFTDSNIIPTHNFCLTVFYKMGFVGLVLFLFINIYVFYYALRYLKQCKTEFIKLILKGSLGSLFFLYIMALFFDVIDSPPTSIFLWILCGLIFGAVEADKNLMKNVEKPLR